MRTGDSFIHSLSMWICFFHSLSIVAYIAMMLRPCANSWSSCCKNGRECGVCQTLDWSNKLKLLEHFFTNRFCISRERFFDICVLTDCRVCTLLKHCHLIHTICLSKSVYLESWTQIRYIVKTIVPSG